MIKNILKAISGFFEAFWKESHPNEVKDAAVSMPPVAEIPTVPEKTNQQRLYDMAKACLTPARDVSPNDIASDEVACVESFDNIHKLTFGTFINATTSKPVLSTIVAYGIFRGSLQWQQVPVPEPGDVIIAVTGTGNGNLSNGHIGICGKHGIMSNSSSNGKWEQNYTYEKWAAYYEQLGGFKSRYFKKL